MRRFALGLMLWGSAAAAQRMGPPLDAKLEAKRHFARGIEQASDGDLTLALQEFERAYATSPHFSVLYNIGRARSTLGRPVEALAAFERYLTEGAGQISSARRAEVEQLIAATREKIGSLRVTAQAPERTRVWLDGVEVPTAKLGSPLFLPVGEHTVLQVVGSGGPTTRDIHVTSGRETEVTIAAPPDEKSPPGLAFLRINCDVPDVRVDVTSLNALTTPIDHVLAITAMPVAIRFSRAGYEPSRVTISPPARELTPISCSMRPLAPLPATFSGYLDVSASPEGVSVWVDGKRFSGDALPTGIHRLKVERAGYQAQQKLVHIQKGKTLKLDLKLAPTAETLALARARTSRKRASALALGGIGTAFLALGLGLYAWNNDRFDDWRATRAGLPVDENLTRAASLQRADDAALGSLILGAGLSVGATWLFFGTER